MVAYGEISSERMFRAVEKVRERLLRATAALEKAGVPYAVVGGHAVAAWVSRVDEAAVRNTQDVDIMLNRADLPGAIAALKSVGLEYTQSFGVDLFLDGPNGNPRHAVHVVFAQEKVKNADLSATPDVSQSEQGPEFRLVQLEALVRMKLTSFRRKDQVHLLDMIGVGLIDATWPTKFPPELARRLQELLDNPEG